MRRVRAAMALGAWLVFLSGSTLALARSGDGRLAAPATADVGSWLEVTGAVPAAFALVRLAAVGLGLYLILLTVASVALRLVGADSSAAKVESLTPARVGRLVRAAVAGSLAVATMAPVPAGARAAEAPVMMRRLPDVPTTTSGGSVVMHRLADTAAVPSMAAPAPDDPAPTWTVAPGDSFWGVAERVLDRSWGRSPSDDEIDPYWRRLIEHNRPVLVDPHNPDLLHPGQALTLPPPPDRPARGAGSPSAA